MKSPAESILSRGLAAGYAGNHIPEHIQHGPFSLKGVMSVFPDGSQYIDRWIAKRVGGGQEIAQTGEEMATRVFAGGVVNNELLKTLGITKEHVIEYLKKNLNERAHETRLHERVDPPADGDWKYTYEVMKEYPDVPLTIGVETISYKNTNVFVHVFLNTPIV